MILDEGKRHWALSEFKKNLHPLLELAEADASVTDIHVNGEMVEVCRGEARSEHAIDEFKSLDGMPLSNSKIQGAAKNAAVYSATSFGPGNPILSVAMPPNYRVSVVMPMVGREWYMTIRFLPRTSIPLETYVEDGIMTAGQFSEIDDLIQQRRNIVISGGTGSGKTTMLRAMAMRLPKGERIVTIEDAAELNIDRPGVVSMYAMHGVADMAALLRQALRLTPKRIILGECRGPEALELVRAWNTGHKGGMATIHSNGKEETIPRLYTLVAEAQPTFPMNGILAAVDAVIQIEVESGKRRVSSIWMVPDPVWV